MLEQDQIEEINEWLDGIKATDNFLNVKVDVQRYVAQAVELFHNVGANDQDEIAQYVTDNLTRS